MTEEFETVTLLRPLLPEAKYITPYLERIDKSRWYSNLGPLVQEVITRSCEHFGMPDGCAVTTSSGTAGLVSVLRAMNLPRDSYCLMPSWTFVATPGAALGAEMVPYFMDVDDETWALDPDAVRAQLKDIKGVIGAVIAVAPYGRAIDLAAWQKFSADTSIPVVVDAAAGWDCFRDAPIGNIPVVVSLHATKIMGCGEGGLVLSKDTGLMRHVQEQTNFGFYTRHISTPGVNAKMSEYSAAVALAAMDTWPDHREAYRKTTKAYIDHIGPVAKKHNINLWMDDDRLVSTCNMRLSTPDADSVISQLQVRGVKARQWWDKGCHRQPAYAQFPKTELPMTEKIASSLVSLPYYIDMPEKHIKLMAQHLVDILE